MALIVCQCGSPTAPDTTAWLWVFGEDAASRLESRRAEVVARPEVAELVRQVREQQAPPQDEVWLGGIDAYHPPPSTRFRLVWTLPPAPCRIYTRRGLAACVEPGVVTRHLRGRREQLAVRSSSVVEGWISSDWTHAGISLKGDTGEAWEVIRLRNAGPFSRLLIMYDGIDLMVDTAWLDRVTPRVADVLGVEWRIVDHTVTPPEVTGQSART
jgi:hypothetical protein